MNSKYADKNREDSTVGEPQLEKGFVIFQSHLTTLSQPRLREHLSPESIDMKLRTCPGKQAATRLVANAKFIGFIGLID